MRETKCGFIDGPLSARDLLINTGPTLFVNIGFDPDFRPIAPAVPVPAITGVHALVDTGAGECCIDDQLAVKLRLPLIDRRSVSGIGGRKEVNMYLAQIHVPSLPHTIYGAFAGVDLVAGGQAHQALIGRTFLRSFTMIYSGLTGDVTLRDT